MKKILAFFLSLVILMSLLPAAFAVNGTAQDNLKNFTQIRDYPEGKFKDIPADAWFIDSVAESYELGLFNGNSDTRFDPFGNITVAQCIALASRLNSIYYTGEANFVQGDPWYKCYTDYATEKGILNPADFTDYNRAATRREVAYLFAHALPEEALAQINTVTFSAVPDVTMDSRWSEEIYTLYRAGIVGGYDDAGTFFPDTPIQRAQVAAMIVRMAKSDARVSVTLAEAADLPDTFKRSSERGVETFHHATTTVPTVFGLPKLTDAEIDVLVASEDYQYVADSIVTLADCVNYFVRAGFHAQESDYDHYWFTHICGQQVVARRGGHCGAMCNATAYLLNGDYEELGFNMIDRHVQMYAKIDGLYYMLNPVDYAKAEGAYWIDGWFKGVNNGAILCAADMQTIADSWYEAGWTTERFQTYVSPGDMFPQYRKDTYTWVFPTGVTVNDWFGHDVLYGTPEFKEYIGPPKHWGKRLPTIDWTTGTDWVDEKYIN